MLKLELNPRQEILRQCRMCHQSIDAHDDDCPIGIAKRLRASLPLINCPCCDGRNTVFVNSKDFLECEDCHVQYSKNIRDSMGNTSIMLSNDRVTDGELAVFAVYILEAKGTGDFPLLTRLSELDQSIYRAK